MLSLIKRPVLRSELPKQRMHDLEQIHAVEAAEKPFIALIVGGRMEHAVVHETIIVSVQHLSQQKELRLQALCITAQPPQEAFVQTVRHIQPQPVDVKLLHPAFHALQKIVHHLLIAQVQLHQIIVPLPALIPKAVIVVGIPVEVNPMEPIDIGGSSPVSQHIHKRPEPSAHMIEYTVQHHLDALLVQSIAHLLKVLVGSQTHIHLPVVSGIVAMGVRLKQRRKIHRVHSKLLHMRYPVQHLQDTVLQHPVIFKRRTAEPQRIDLVEHAFKCPHCFSS